MIPELVPNGFIMSERARLDRLLVKRGLAATRSRAADAIRRGTVRVEGQAVDKPGLLVPLKAGIEIRDPAGNYVSRAALKLIAGLDRFGLDPRDRVGLDLGASTGGFTQVLLERGAARVHAVDVGHGQLHHSLKADPRVIEIEGLNARDLAAAHIGEKVGAIVGDVSFISLRLVLPPALALAAPEAFLLVLVKPQFELGREAIGKGGIVRDEEAGEVCAREMADWLKSLEGAWTVLGITPSPIEGSDGNREFLLAARRGP